MVADDADRLMALYGGFVDFQPLGSSSDEHFNAWFRQSFGGEPAVLRPDLTFDVVRALYDAMFAAHVAEGNCVVFVDLGFGAAPVQCVAERVDSLNGE